MSDCRLPCTKFELVHEIGHEEGVKIKPKLAELLGKSILDNKSVVHGIMSRSNIYTGWDEGRGTDYILDKLADDTPSGLEDRFAYIFDRPSMVLVIYTSLSVAYPPVGLCP